MVCGGKGRLNRAISFIHHRIGLSETQTLRELEGGALDRHASYSSERACAIRFKLRPFKPMPVFAMLVSLPASDFDPLAAARPMP